MTYLEIKYINLLSNRLRNFKQKSNSVFNFSCPICLDSETNTHKARGYIYPVEGKLKFKCHNCGYPASIPWFIKQVDERLYMEFRREQLLEEGHHFKEPEEEVKFDKVDRLKIFDHRFDTLQRISTIDVDHYAREYVANRLIPKERWSDLYYCPEFYAYANLLIPHKFSEKALKFDKPRLFIPFRDNHKNMVAFQGRAFVPDEVKYITISLNDNPTLYGMDRVDMSKDVFNLEGPIDAMCLNNAIATAGGDIVSKVKDLPKDKLIIVYDNEPRSPQTVKKMLKVIEYGFRICIWPDSFNFKDVNEAIMKGLKSEQIENIIKINTFKGIYAKLRLNQWKKC